MNELSNRLNRLSPSATLAMSQKSGELKAQGIDIINMSVGEPDFNTPDHIKAAAIKAVEENWSRYSPVAGYPAWRKEKGGSNDWKVRSLSYCCFIEAARGCSADRFIGF